MSCKKSLPILLIILASSLCEKLNDALEITLFDARYIWELPSNSDAHEHMQLLAALGGLVNRNGPNLFISAIDRDDEWLEWLRSPGKWLENATFVEETSVTALVEKYRSFVQGAVLYDGGVPSTSNIASTIAGVEDLLPILSGGSLYSELCTSGPQLAVVHDLLGMFDGSVTGSRKNDAYEWLRTNYMGARRIGSMEAGGGSRGSLQLPNITSSALNPAVQGYFMDYWWALNSSPDVDRLNVAVLNSDWVVANRGLLWDLDVWPDTAPNDDPSASPGVDFDTLNRLQRSAYDMLGGKSMMHIAGFVPWSFKYITDEHDGVATEWQAVKLLSAYNAFVDADACCEINTFANAAFYQHYPLADAEAGTGAYKQNAAPSYQQLVDAGYVDAVTGLVVPKNYISFYVGDYDSAAWVFNELRSKWDDPARGSVPLGWAVNPTAAVRFPPIFDYLYSSLTASDRITTGDSGAGYVNPTQLLYPRELSGLPSAEEVWTAHCEQWYERFDMAFTGFLINGASGAMTREAELMYASFSPFGGTEQMGYAPEGQPQGVPHMMGGMPFFQETDISSDPSAAAQLILDEDAAGQQQEQGNAQFHVYRSILQSPSYHAEVVQQVNAQTSNVVVVDPLVLSALASISLS